MAAKVSLSLESTWLYYHDSSELNRVLSPTKRHPGLTQHYVYSDMIRTCVTQHHGVFFFLRSRGALAAVHPVNIKRLGATKKSSDADATHAHSALKTRKRGRHPPSHEHKPQVTQFSGRFSDLKTRLALPSYAWTQTARPCAIARC